MENIHKWPTLAGHGTTVRDCSVSWDESSPTHNCYSGLSCSCEVRNGSGLALKRPYGDIPYEKQRNITSNKAACKMHAGLRPPSAVVIARTDY